ncbi:MAG: transporter substrate-binding domain-containing protein [Coriobacteriales bacterium]|nr:transporter substrate-binding domain-containing protein [Coriobacteriales bacterium]
MRARTWKLRLVAVVCTVVCALVLLPALAKADQTQEANGPVPTYKTLDELAGKQFAYVNGSVYNQYVQKKIPNTEESFYASLPDCVAAVEGGKADAAVQLSYCCEAVVNRKGGTVALLPEHVGEVEEAFFFPKGDPLISKFNSVIKKFEEDGTIDRLTKKWVGTDESVKTLPAQDWDAPNGTLKFATSGVLDPFSYVGANGEILGYDVDLALNIAKELGYHLDVSTITMDAIFASVQTGKVDFGGTLTNTPERTEMVDFSEKVMPTYISVIVKAEDSGQAGGTVLELNEPKDLAGKKLGTVTGSVYKEIAEEAVPGLTDKSFSHYETISDMVGALKSRKIDACIEGKATAELAVAENSGIGIMSQPIAQDEVGMCLKKDSPLTAKFNEQIETLRKEGTLEQLREKWMGADDSAKTMPAQDWEAPNGKLNVICSTLEPMSYVGGNGEVKGYEAELVCLIAKKLGYSVSFTSAPFSGILPSIESGKSDVAIGNISITEERKQKVDMTVPDYDSAVVAVVRVSDSAVAQGKSFMDDIVQSFNKTFLQEGRWQLILSGLGVTALISVCAGALGTALGFVIVVLRRKGNKVVGKIVDGYQAIIGGVPIVVVLMVLYYVIFGSSSIPGELVAIIAFTLSFGSTASTTMWTAVRGIDIGQEESGLALGYESGAVFRKIILPQAAQQFLPQLVGQFVGLVKETAVVGYIAVQDLTRASDLIRARTMDAFFPLVSTAIIYFVLCRLLAWALNRVADRLNPVNKPRKIKGVM